MTWLILLVAIALEISGTTCMKLSAGFTRLVPSVLMVLFYGGAFTALTFVLNRMEVSTAYAVWSALGTAIVAIIGILYFGESLSAAKVISLAMILAGVIGLRLSGGGS